MKCVCQNPDSFAKQRQLVTQIAKNYFFFPYLDHQPRLMIQCPMSLLEILAVWLVDFVSAPNFAIAVELVVDETAVV